MFQGMKNIRGEHEQIEYTKEMLDEYIKCKEDIIYFAEKYVWITTLDKGNTIIKLYDYQKKILKAFIDPPEDKRHVIILQPRQSGKTTISTVYLLHYMLFNKDKNIAILANKEKTAINIARRIQMAYKELPLWLQQGIKIWKKTGMELENGCVVTASTTSPDSISGDSVNLLYMDEFAKVKPHIADEFLTATYPVISSGKTSKIIMTSTPLGMNHFYEFWINAVRRYNNFYPIKVGWWEHPDRDDEWKADIIRDIGIVRFNQEYGCLGYDTNINIRDKITGEIETIKIGELYNRLEVS